MWWPGQTEFWCFMGIKKRGKLASLLRYNVNKQYWLGQYEDSRFYVHTIPQFPSDWKQARERKLLCEQRDIRSNWGWGESTQFAQGRRGQISIASPKPIPFTAIKFTHRFPYPHLTLNRPSNFHPFLPIHGFMEIPFHSLTQSGHTGHDTHNNHIPTLPNSQSTNWLVSPTRVSFTSTQTFTLFWSWCNAAFCGKK